MKRPKLRKGSKRVSCSTRFKIQKKVREHNRKLRKDAKKKGGPKRVKKDPGIPNSAPFKEEVLREAELRRKQLEELKLKQKLDRQQEQAKKRKADVKKKESPAKTKPVKQETSNKKQPKFKPAQNTNTPKLFCQGLNKVIQEADVIIELLDARDPIGCRCPQLEQAVLQAPGNKRILLVLNKIDLVPKQIVVKWLESLKNDFPTVAFKCATQLQDRSMEVKRKMKEGCIDMSRGNTCHGDEELVNFLRAYCKSPEQVLKVGVVGFPNVGKSSLINSLKQARVCNVGPLKGITKCVQEVNIMKNIKLLDSPSIVAAPSNSPVTLCIRSAFDTRVADLCSAVNTILKHCKKEQIMMHYCIADYRNTAEFLVLLAQKRGMLEKGGVPNTESAARLLLSDWNGTRLSYHCQPPASLPLHPHLSEAVIAEMWQGVNLKELELKNMDTIKRVRSPSLANSMLFQSPGLTNGILAECEIVAANQAVDIAEDLSSEDEVLEDIGDDYEDDSVDEDNENMEAETSGDLPTRVPDDTVSTKPEESGKKAVTKRQQLSAGTKLKTEYTAISVDLDRSTQPGDAYDFSTDYV